MKHASVMLAFATALILSTSASAAGCYADYKAKQDNPLRLHYGVLELRGECATGAARSEVNTRLQASGWTLLNVLSVFGSEGLEKRRANAGTYFLRF